MKILGVIPARYASTRFPGKPLAVIGGKSMIRRVYEQSLLCRSLDEVIVATDDARIHDHVLHFGGKSMITSSKHQSGTERAGEVISALADEGKFFDVVVNIQGDEPFIDPDDISLVISCFSDPVVEITTLVKPVEKPEKLHDPNVVKVMMDLQGRAICFSRSVIPFLRGVKQEKWLDHHSFYSHVGIYAYRTNVLQVLVKLPHTPAEIAESLEQMRWIEHGYSIFTKVTLNESPAIDMPEDLLKLTNII